eukprot:TRINITY_DN779_c0_g1_i1.p1 TRINITY_DN779_c0_g1~~TRINITY_DN779_c0_g1_i1.p1  ORF type:complete len:476 (-),score=169.89 TRINITY_DN779_c0_g1_i1:80-1507(-)
MGKDKKYSPEDYNVSVASLGGGEKSGWLTKEGGSVRSWKKRYFVLKGKHIYYFKSQKDTTMTGRIDLEPSSTVVETNLKQPYFAFCVKGTRRPFNIYSETPQDRKEWMDTINRNIRGDSGKSNGTSAPLSHSNDNNAASRPIDAPKQPSQTDFTQQSQQRAGGESGTSPRRKLESAKQAVPFLRDKNQKVYEFWAIWSESIPPRSDLAVGGTIEFYVTASADMQKLTWRTNGPQSIFIQKMVDFFWNVGAPADEIDRLNDVGAIINPAKIGSWIDMSRMGGMDGGWYFPVEIPIKHAMEAADPGNAIKEFAAWAEQNDIQTAFAVGRDMGAAPPRQTELRFKLPHGSPSDQIEVGLSAFSRFGFPAFPDEALRILKNQKIQNSADAHVSLSVITSAEGFVRLGLLVPRPSPSDVSSLCTFAGGSHQNLSQFEESIEVTKEGPLFVEYQYLKNPFGYGVYREGFDIVFHYRVGIED